MAANLNLYNDVLQYVYPSSFEFGIIYNTTVSTSPLSGHSKTIAMPGARWRMRMSFEDKTQADIRKIMAFLAELRGMDGRFQAYDITHEGPLDSTVVATTGTIDSFTGTNQVNFSTFTGDLSVGDYFGITDGSDIREVKMVTQVLGSDDYKFEPMLREADTIYTGTATFIKPETNFMLTSDEQAYWPSTGRVPMSSIDIEAIEAF